MKIITVNRADPGKFITNVRQDRVLVNSKSRNKQRYEKRDETGVNG